MKQVARIQAERGEDEEGLPPDPALVASCLAEAREAEGLPPLAIPVDAGAGGGGAAAAAASRPRPRGLSGSESTEEEEEEGVGGGEKRGDASGRREAPASARSGTATGAKAPAPPAEPPKAPRKRLTAVLFADSNTHVLVTGDSSGRVDVWRVQGVAFPGEETDTSARVDALHAALKTLA